MIINSEGRQRNQIFIGYLKGTICIACRSYYMRFFFNLEGIFSQILDPANSKVAAPQLFIILDR